MSEQISMYCGIATVCPYREGVGLYLKRDRPLR